MGFEGCTSNCTSQKRNEEGITHTVHGLRVRDNTTKKYNSYTKCSYAATVINVYPIMNSCLFRNVLSTIS
jgi:hypothetical protein